jgi:hypothetical protein
MSDPLVRTEFGLAVPVGMHIGVYQIVSLIGAGGRVRQHDCTAGDPQPTSPPI